MNIIPLYTDNKDLENGVISVSAFKNVTKQWHKMLIGKNYFEALEIIKNEKYTHRIVKLDDVVFPISTTNNVIDKKRVNLIMESNIKFKNDVIQKIKKINTWLNVDDNKKKCIIRNIEIY